MSPSAGSIRRWAGAAFVVVAFAFLAVYVARNFEALATQEWDVRPGLLLGSVLLNIFGLFWGVASWKVLLRSLGQELSLLELARIWFISALGRYIPGKVWQFVGAAHAGRASGVPAFVTVASLAAHQIFFLIAAALTSIYLLPASLWIDPTLVRAGRIAAPLLLLLVHPRVVSAAFRAIGRLGKREVTEWQGGWGVGAVIVLLAGVNWIISGAALYLFLLSLTPISLDALPAVMGINAVTFIIGNAVFVAPAGLGAKEWSLTILLAPYLPAPVAAVMAVAVRFWTIAAEVLPALLLLRRVPRPRDAAPPEEGVDPTTRLPR